MVLYCGSNAFVSTPMEVGVEELTVAKAGQSGGLKNLENNGVDALRERAMKAALASKLARDRRRAAGEPMLNIRKKGDGTMPMTRAAQMGGKALAEKLTPERRSEIGRGAQKASLLVRRAQITERESVGLQEEAG